MSKFRKVSEIDNIPSFIQNKFVGAQVDVEEDPYADLKRNSTENRFKMSKQQVGMGKEASNLEKSWEKISGAAKYEDLRPASMEESLLNNDFGSIRRSDYGVDEGLNARTTTSGLQAFSSEEYMDAMLRGSASIFNPDMIALSQEFLNSQENTSEQVVAQTQASREAKASRHKDWEDRAINTIRKSNTVNARAHSILRTSSDTEYSSQFGMIDSDKLDQRESMRIASQQKLREEKNEIKSATGRSFEQKSQQPAKTLRDIYNNIDLNFDDLD
jgi:hypothetical protein